MEAFALNLLWVGPIVGALGSFFFSRRSLGKWVAFHAAVYGGLWGYLLLRYSGQGPFVELPWFRFGEKELYFALGLRPSNAALVFLTYLVGFAALVYSLPYIQRPRFFAALFFLAVAFCEGVFLAGDVFLFFVFYEASLVPAFLLIRGWGGVGRSGAAVRFALFTLGGSVFLLVGLLWGFAEKGESRLALWQASVPGVGAWLLMTVGLAVKLPLFPLHNWLGEAHVEAETGVSMVLAGLFLKLGGYGLLEWVWYDMPEEWRYGLLGWGLLSLWYALGVAAGQSDLKRLIAFTSISHMAFVALGAGSGSSMGMQGAYHQLFTHGIVSAGLFAWAGLLEKRRGSRSLAVLAGGLSRREKAAMVFLFFGAMGVPGLALFISEVFVLGGVGMGAGWGWSGLSAVSLPLTGLYFLRAYRQLSQSGEVPVVSSFSTGEVIVWGLIALMVAAGVYPQPWLDLLAHVGH